MPATTNYNFSYPTVGSDQDSWGGTLNTTIVSIDTNLKTVSDAIPTSIVASSITDTPNNFTSSASKFVKVNSSGNAIEFVTASITDLSDTPSSLGSANQILKMNSGGTALEWGTDASGSGGITLSNLSVSSLGASGSGSLSYSNSNGVFTFRPPDLSAYQTTSSASKVYTSGWQNFQSYGTTGTSTFTHSLGGEPDIIMMQFKCTSSNLNYSTNDIVSAQHGVVSDASNVFGFYHDNTTQIKIVQPAYQRVQIVNKTSGVPQLITGSSWQWRVKCVKI